MMTEAFLVALSLVGSACGLSVSTGVADCSGKCVNGLHLDSSGGIENTFSRYTGTWKEFGTWEGNPFYRCVDCQGLDNEMVYYENAWRIVDCFPDNDFACSGFHSLILSDQAASCPWESDALPWSYCDGDVASGGVCSHYSVDDTAHFTCLAKQE